MLLFLLARRSHAYVMTLASSGGGGFHHISGKNERIQTKLGRKKLGLRHKGNPQENLGPIACVAHHAADFFCLFICRQPVWPLQTEKTTAASNHVILLIYAHRQKFHFFTRRKRGIEKVRFSGFWGGWVFCLSATSYTVYRVRPKNVPRQKLRFLKNRSVNLHGTYMYIA